LVGGGREGVEATLIPSPASILGYQGGGQPLMPVNMRHLFPIWDTVTPATVPTTQVMPLTEGGKH